MTNHVWHQISFHFQSKYNGKNYFLYYAIILFQVENSNDSGDVIKEIIVHSKSVFGIDFPFYILLAYRMHR